MSSTDRPEQIGTGEMKRLAKEDPAALVNAMRAGQLNDILHGHEPGACPTCKRPMMTDPPPPSAA